MFAYGVPMGCSILCHFFEMISMDWVVRFETDSQSIIQIFFCFVAPGGSDRCLFVLNSFSFRMSHFGVPLSAEKKEGLSTTISFLEIEIDSMAMVFCLPVDKLTKLKDLIAGFLGVKSVTLK